MAASCSSRTAVETPGSPTAPPPAELSPTGVLLVSDAALVSVGESVMGVDCLFGPWICASVCIEDDDVLLDLFVSNARRASASSSVAKAERKFF